MPIASRRLRTTTARLASLAGIAIVLSCGWFATMELVLRHDGYGWRALVAAAVVALAMLTTAVFENLVDVAPLRWPLSTGAAATVFFGLWIVAADLSRPGLPSRPHFEGYLLIIGLTLIAYGLLTIAAILVRTKRVTPATLEHRRLAKSD